MEWGFMLVVALAIPILFWVALIWSGVFARLYLLIRDVLRQRIIVWETAGRLARTTAITIVLAGVHVFAGYKWLKKS